MSVSTVPSEQSGNEIAPRLVIEYLNNSAIIVFTVCALPSRELVDVWHETITDYAHQRTDNRHFIMYDLSKLKNFQLTPYLREQLTATAKQNSDVIGRCAVILPHNPLIRMIIQLFVRRDTARLQPNLTTKVYGKRDLGLAWIQQALTDMPHLS